jgi:hypothetical protein
MFYASLVLSAVLWLIATRAVYRADSPSSIVVPAALAFAGLPVLATCFFPAVALQSILLVVVLVAWTLWRGKPRSFVALSLGATAAAYAVVGWLAFQTSQRLLEEHPYVSMEERLPKAPACAGLLPDATVRHLDELEGMLEHRDAGTKVEDQRVSYLRQLHEKTLQVFLAQPEFGVARMPGVTEWVLRSGLRDGPPLPQPGAARTSRWSAAAFLEPSAAAPAEPGRDLLWLHMLSVTDFVNANGFGFFKDRQHVAGFQPHQVSEPRAAQGWVLQTLDLVGLVRHDEPVAYVSNHLPRMDELRAAPTRPLDAFEAAGLAALRRGDLLFARRAADDLRLLGSIRSTRQCISCHGGQRGELLGAFSYTFTSGKGG